MNAVEGHSQMAHFAFYWNGQHLEITKSSTKKVDRAPEKGTVGCGKNITWKDMAPVRIPDEFRETKAVTVDVVKHLPPPAQQGWRGVLRTAFSQKQIQTVEVPENKH